MFSETKTVGGTNKHGFSCVEHFDESTFLPRFGITKVRRDNS